MKTKRIDGYVVCVDGSPATAGGGAAIVVYTDRAAADAAVEPSYGEAVRRVRVEVEEVCQCRI